MLRRFAIYMMFSASKAALNMFTSHMAEEFSAIGVRVNSVASDSFPGGITTQSVCDASRASIATR
jgi:NAD(P)-dependent dehydrogenase (short-subunit alcohol dehydrogenase family)